MQKERGVDVEGEKESEEEEQWDHDQSRDFEVSPSQIMKGEHMEFDSLVQAIEGRNC